ncbi:dTMP kinase [Arthrobacter sp. KK5.5]|uniref:dTMP kinase n=1 Tax=Arthrobacter sp. KK5.5 TaxID=3373084 RepID=UPI003EE67C85
MSTSDILDTALHSADRAGSDGTRRAARSGPATRRTIVVVGIDGAGKTTAARALVAREQAAGRPAQLLRNPGGRRWLSRRAETLGLAVPPPSADRFETVVRTANVIAAHLRALAFGGTSVMDRHLVCQLVLRRVRGLPSGRALGWLAGALPRPDAVVLLDVPPEIGHARVLARGEDSETPAYLSAARTHYLSLAAEHGWHLVDATGSPDEVAGRIEAVALPR